MDHLSLQFLFQMVLASFLGALLGIEREIHHKAAGLRTHTLVSLGACLFTIISIFGFKEFAGPGGYNPSLVAAQVITGIGFIGAGLIIFRGGTVQGLTTAAALWVAAAIGMAVGVRMYWVAAFAAVLAVFVLRVLSLIEPQLREKNNVQD